MMYRRTLLSGIGVGPAGVSGCLGGDGGTMVDGTDGEADSGTTSVGSEGETAGTPTNGSAPTTGGGAGRVDQRTAAPQSRFRNVELPIPDDELRRGAPKDRIPAITDPQFGPDWSDVEVDDKSLSLADGDEVIGVSRNGNARAYPLRILDWHEIVNDTLGGPLLVTFCPLCGSGMTAERRVDGQETFFGVSGLLFKNDLVMYDDATDSRWSQIMATAIQGSQTGETLTLVPSSLTTWGEWRQDHPDTEVLLPPPASDTITGAPPRNYGTEPYAGYEDSRRIGIGGTNLDDRLHPKTWVIGVADGDVVRAYPVPAVRKAGVVNDTVGSLPVVVSATEGETAGAYVRRLDGETVRFERDGRFLVADGSRFRLTDGVAVDGPHEGTRLDQASSITREFWFAWANFHPETEIWSQDG